jgi:ubiquinone/menaquinone biosynthesis C-methylase UbiE
MLSPTTKSDFDKVLLGRYEVTSGGSPFSVSIIAKKMLGDVRGKTILDVGCSEGKFAFQNILPCGAKVVIGVDFAAGAIRIAQQHAITIPNALFIVGDAMALPIKSDKFDRVIITEVIEHLPNVDNCLAELRRVVKKEGEIVLSTPNYFNMVGIFKRLFDHFYFKGRERWTYALHDEELEHFQTPFSVQRQFSQAGLDVLEFRGSDLWQGISKAIIVPWLFFDYMMRKLEQLILLGFLTKSILKYFGVVQYYRLRKE